jgi:hypothetical protein
MDNQSAYRLTSKLVATAKREALKVLCPEKAEIQKVAGKKRKKADFDKDMEAAAKSHKIIETFENEDDLKPFYEEDEEGTKAITISDWEEFQDKPLYVALDIKETTSSFDLKEEVILTMLNQLEKSNDYFRVDSILPRSVALRFHKQALDELAEDDKFFATI